MYRDFEEEDMDRAPAFQFYASSWISSTALMDAEQRGWYIQLLAWAWWNADIQGTLPNDEEYLMKIAGVSDAVDNKNFNSERIAEKPIASSAIEKRWKAVRNKFVEVPDNTDLLHNKRLSKVLKEQSRYRKRKRLAGEAGAKARWNKDVNSARKESQYDSNATPMPTDGSLSLPLSLEILKEKSTKKEKGNVKVRKTPETFFIEAKFVVTEKMVEHLFSKYKGFSQGDIDYMREKFIAVYTGKTQVSWSMTFYKFVSNQLVNYGYYPGKFDWQNNQRQSQSQGARANGKESAGERQARVLAENQQFIQGQGDATADEDQNGLQLTSDDFS